MVQLQLPLRCLLLVRVVCLHLEGWCHVVWLWVGLLLWLGHQLPRLLWGLFGLLAPMRHLEDPITSFLTMRIHLRPCSFSERRSC